LLPHSLCRSTTANAPANRQMPIASVVRGSSRKKNTSAIWDKIFDELLRVSVGRLNVILM